MRLPQETVVCHVGRASEEKRMDVETNSPGRVERAKKKGLVRSGFA
jgi:hypothetical protein